jgi:transcription elongation factor Elf1
MYSTDEARRIRESFARLTDQLLCPRCDDELLVSPLMQRHGGTLQEVFCPTCHRCVIVRNLPERPASQ